jgi:hypothetical protein
MTGLNLVPLSDVQDNGYESPRVLAARLQREEAEEKAKQLKAAEDLRLAPVREYEAAMRELALQQTARLTKWWSRSVADVEEGIRFDECPVDDIGLDQTETPASMESFEASVKNFADSLPAKGITFTDDNSRRKWALYCWNAATTGTAINPQSLQILTERASALGIGITLPRVTKKETTEKPEPTYDELEAGLSTQSTAGNKELQKLAVDFAMTHELREMWAAFEGSLYRNFNGFKLSKKQWLLIYETIQRQGLNMMKAESFDLARIARVKSNDLPSHLLYPIERLQIEMEHANLADPNVRREFNTRQRQLTQAAQ